MTGPLVSPWNDGPALLIYLPNERVFYYHFDESGEREVSLEYRADDGSVGTWKWAVGSGHRSDMASITGASERARFLSRLSRFVVTYPVVDRDAQHWGEPLSKTATFRIPNRKVLAGLLSTCHTSN